MDWQEADALLSERGDPLFLLDLSVVRGGAGAFSAAFRAEFADAEVAYAYKANRLAPLCAAMHECGLMAEVASVEELALARSLGITPDRTVATVRAWPQEAVADVLLAGCLVNLDSLRDVRVAVDVARQAGDRDLAVGLRCGMPVNNPAVRSHGLAVAGGEFDEAVALLGEAPGIRLAGLHCHVPEHGVDQVAARADWLAGLAGRLSERPEYLDVGGGFRASPAAYASALRDVFAARFPDPSRYPRLIIEPGTALVAEAVSLLTRVISVERGDAGTVAVVAASVLHTSPIMRRADFRATVLRSGARGAPGAFHAASASPLVGDYVAVDLAGPVAEGDVILLEGVGAYSISAASCFVPAASAVVREGAGSPWQLV